MGEGGERGWGGGEALTGNLHTGDGKTCIYAGVVFTGVVFTTTVGGKRLYETDAEEN